MAPRPPRRLDNILTTAGFHYFHHRGECAAVPILRKLEIPRPFRVPACFVSLRAVDSQFDLDADAASAFTYLDAILVSNLSTREIHEQSCDGFRIPYCEQRGLCHDSVDPPPC